MACFTIVVQSIHVGLSPGRGCSSPCPCSNSSGVNWLQSTGGMSTEGGIFISKDSSRVWGGSGSGWGDLDLDAGLVGRAFAWMWTPGSLSKGPIWCLCVSRCSGGLEHSRNEFGGSYPCLEWCLPTFLWLSFPVVVRIVLVPPLWGLCLGALVGGEWRLDIVDLS